MDTKEEGHKMDSIRADINHLPPAIKKTKVGVRPAVSGGVEPPTLSKAGTTRKTPGEAGGLGQGGAHASVEVLQG